MCCCYCVESIWLYFRIVALCEFVKENSYQARLQASMIDFQIPDEEDWWDYEGTRKFSIFIRKNVKVLTIYIRKTKHDTIFALHFCKSS
eukprot:snap_masked-scaffold_1-processed-gene-25.43-mRNA-1 protein AED:1.00 eAED:1.00 QI:0/-1/0/0/-1/1/1/0/88